MGKTATLLAIVVFVSFAPTLRNDFTGYDDPDYVTANPRVTSGLTSENVRWAFATAHSSNWHPLTWLSHSLDCQLFGLNPAGHHLTSLLLHIVNTMLIFLWLSNVTGFRWPSAFVALLFGLHPLHVESVAWVSERKDVLSTMFWMLTLLAYTSYVKRPGVARYCLVALLFAAGLLAKPMLVTVPLILLLLDWWPLKRTERWQRLVCEKLPLLALSALSCMATVWAQRQSGSVATVDQLPVWLRLSNATVSYLRYLGKTVWPAKLAAFYPFPLQGIPIWKVAGSLLLISVASWLAFSNRKRHPWLTIGWFWYLVTLLPVIGIVQVGMQAMADRYMYVPLIGLLIALTWECAERAEGSQRVARALPVAAVLVLAACAVLSWRQLHFWKDGVTLFTHAIQVTQDNFTAHNNLGVELDRRGQLLEALSHYRETLRIKPGDRNGERNYAQASFALGVRLFDEVAPGSWSLPATESVPARVKLDAALASLREGLRHQPGNALAHTYVGLILTQQQHPAAAILELRRALDLDPTLARAHMALGVALAWSGQADEARQAFENTVRYDPTNVEAHYDLGLVQTALGQNGKAIESFDSALRLNPGFGPAHAARAEALYAIGRYDEAWRAILAARAANVEVDPVFAAKVAARIRP